MSECKRVILRYKRPAKIHKKLKMRNKNEILTNFLTLNSQFSCLLRRPATAVEQTLNF